MVKAPPLTLRTLIDRDMTPEKALRIGRMVGKSFKTVCVGGDANQSTRMIKNSVISGILSAGANVMDAGTAPAPAVALASKGSGCVLMVGEPDELGVISGVDMMNPDGSLLTRDQLRRLIKKGEEDRDLPGYKDVGSIRLCDSVVENYNRVISDIRGRSVDAPVVLDCGCGCTSLCAPSILTSSGAELTAINSQFDTLYSPRPPGIEKGNIIGLSEIIAADPGSIGIALNGDGTRLALFDESGEYVNPEDVLALLLLYLKPRTVVVPVNASAVVDDAFYGFIGKGTSTSATINRDRRLIRTDNTVEAITAAIKENSAEMGAMTDGTFIFPSVTMCPDAINASAALVKMSGENNLKNLLASFPKYIVLREEVRNMNDKELFNKKLTDRLHSLDTEEVRQIDGWRVGMNEGWFTVSRNADNEEYIDITTEAKDRMYAVSMMELAKSIVYDCV